MWGFGVHLESVDNAGEVKKRWSVTPPNDERGRRAASAPEPRASRQIAGIGAGHRISGGYHFDRAGRCAPSEAPSRDARGSSENAVKVTSRTTHEPRARYASSVQRSSLHSMKILGIQLRKPSFDEVTASAVMAAGLWLAYIALMKVGGQAFDPVQSGAVLLIIFWGCVCVRFGIHVGRGLQHLLLNVLFGGALLVLYQGAVSLFA